MGVLHDFLGNFDEINHVLSAKDILHANAKEAIITYVLQHLKKQFYAIRNSRSFTSHSQ